MARFDQISLCFGPNSDFDPNVFCFFCFVLFCFVFFFVFFFFIYIYIYIYIYNKFVKIKLMMGTAVISMTVPP